MKKSRFTESQIIGILKEQEQGKKVSDLCREYGISQPTFYQWKSKYSGLDVNQLKRVKELEAEVSQYKKLVAELTLDNRILKDLNSKKFQGPAESGRRLHTRRNVKQSVFAAPANWWEPPPQ